MHGIYKKCVKICKNIKIQNDIKKVKIQKGETNASF